jgi:hypothetical protein
MFLAAVRLQPPGEAEQWCGGRPESGGRRGFCQHDKGGTAPDPGAEVLGKEHRLQQGDPADTLFNGKISGDFLGQRLVY